MNPGVNDYRERLELAARTAAPIFQMFGWKWGMAPNEFIPQEHAIEEELRALLSDAIDRTAPSYMSSGRLYVSRDENGEIEICLQLV